MAVWDAWENPVYCWVVICKNAKVHSSANVNAGHKIPLAETDAFDPPPHLYGPFKVLCDDCGKEYEYTPEEVLRIEMEAPPSLEPHPLFR